MTEGLVTTVTTADLTMITPAARGIPIGRGRATTMPATDEFDEFYAAHFHGLTVQLYAYFGDRHEAQDVVQEAFCRALARWTEISRYDDPVAWVRRVAWNLATSRWRRVRTAVAFASKQREEFAAEPSPDRVALAAALATLPAQQRRAVILYYIADMSIEDVARKEGVPVGTVKSWLHRARTALAGRLANSEVRSA
jgi:RNA polymerase sigma-70 factor, ECF subfamily